MRKRQPKRVSYLTEDERRQMIEEYLKGGKSKVEIWREYTGQVAEHGKILKWMRQLGYADKNVVKPLSLQTMPAKDKLNQTVEELQQKIKLLEQQLLDSQLKEEGYRRMIDIAEKELKISIRKKPNTK